MKKPGLKKTSPLDPFFFSINFVSYNMSVNIDDIKKLPDQEKLMLIDDLLESIDKETIDEYLNQTDDETILQERWAKYKSGDMKFDSWENVEKRLRNNAEQRQQKGSNDLPH